MTNETSNDALFDMLKRSTRLAIEEAWEYDDESEYHSDVDPDAKIVYTEDGSIHVCMGMNCPFLKKAGNADRAFYCDKSGALVSHAIESSHDSAWTGRSCASADPDMNSGAVSQSAWKSKRNAFAASAVAYSRASSISIEEVILTCPLQVALDDDRVVKRGAPCVVDVDDAAVSRQKRAKSLKRMFLLENTDTQTRLLADAQNVVAKLFSTTSQSAAARPEKSSTAARQDSAVAGAASTLQDPRLENYDFVLSMALKRYVARCKANGDAVSISGIHDTTIATNQFVKERLAESSSTRKVDMRCIALNGRVHELCAKLIVTMWAALCSTKYFTTSQSSDSFRPFAAGVMYSLKRGLRLPNNKVLVPSILILAENLPALRSTTTTLAARQLHQASHRGLCALHRGLSSIDTMSRDEQTDVMSKLKIVANVANDLDTFIKQMLQSPL